MSLIKKITRMTKEERTTRLTDLTQALTRKNTQLESLKPQIKSAKKQRELRPLKDRRESLERQMRNITQELTLLNKVG